MKEIHVLKALFRCTLLPHPSPIKPSSIFSVAFGVSSLAQETGGKIGYVNTLIPTLRANAAH